MIFDYTDAEQKELNALSNRYDAQLDKLRQKMDNCQEGTNQYKDAVSAYIRANNDRIQAIENLYNQCEQAHFDALGDDPDKILESGKEQIALAIEKRYQENKKYDWNLDRYADTNNRPDLANSKAQPKLETGQAVTMVKRVLKLHFAALKGKPQHKALENYMYDYIAKSPYTYTDTTGKAPQTEPDFFNMPTSAATDMIFEALAFGDDLSKLPGRKNLITHNSSYIVKESKSQNARQVIKSGKNSEIIVEAGDIDKLLGSNKAAKKIFVLSLMKANEQAVYNGKLVRDYVDFSLQELVDKGLYKSVRTARAGFYAGADVLTSLKLKGHERKKGKDIYATDSDALEVLYTGAHIENGQCYLFLNYRVCWDFIVQYFTILPPYYFRLPNRASDLLYYIFYLARQNTKKIEKQGYFTISFRAIQERLQLPSEAKTINPGRDIKQPIETAIEQIEAAHSAYYHNKEFQLLPVNSDLKNTTDFLDKGYLRVTLLGQFSKKFIELSKAATQKTNEREKRQKQIVDKAKSISLADSMKST